MAGSRTTALTLNHSTPSSLTSPSSSAEDAGTGLATNEPATAASDHTSCRNHYGLISSFLRLENAIESDLLSRFEIGSRLKRIASKPDRSIGFVLPGFSLLSGPEQVGDSCRSQRKRPVKNLSAMGKTGRVPPPPSPAA